MEASMLLSSRFAFSRLLASLVLAGLGCAKVPADPGPRMPISPEVAQSVPAWAANMHITTDKIREVKTFTCEGILAEQPICYLDDLHICALAFCRGEDVTSKPRCQGITLPSTLVRPASQPSPIPPARTFE
jgi:hypothetical protein